MRRTRAAALLVLVALAGAACGHYTAPIRAEPPPEDEGAIYDAGQPADEPEPRP